jgi:hypothetical protein
MAIVVIDVDRWDAMRVSRLAQACNHCAGVNGGVGDGFCPFKIKGIDCVQDQQSRVRASFGTGHGCAPLGSVTRSEQ